MQYVSYHSYELIYGCLIYRYIYILYIYIIYIYIYIYISNDFVRWLKFVGFVCQVVAFNSFSLLWRGTSVPLHVCKCGRLLCVWQHVANSKSIQRARYYCEQPFQAIEVSFFYMAMLCIAKYRMLTPSPKVYVHLNSPDKKQKITNVIPVTECIFPEISFNKAP